MYICLRIKLIIKSKQCMICDKKKNVLKKIWLEKNTFKKRIVILICKHLFLNWNKNGSVYKIT